MALLATLWERLTTITSYAILLLIAYTILRALYDLTLHPLSGYPGPLLCHITQLPKLYHFYGDLPYWTRELHAKYGPVVRTAPNELSLIEPDAWRDIYGRGPGGDEIFIPEHVAYNATNRVPMALLGSPRPVHDAVRKPMAPGFSDKAIQAQEPVVGGYVELLVARLRGQCEGGSRALDLNDWMQFTTFDVIGTLAFGSDFGCLRESGFHPWVRSLTSTTRNLVQLQILGRLGLVKAAVWLMGKLKIGLKARNTHRELVDELAKKRLEVKDGRVDFLAGLIESGAPFDVIKENCVIFTIAGSETTATLLAGAIFLLTTHPEILAKLTAEVRSKFTADTDITLTSVNTLSYMLACLNETLRLYPPVANISPRVATRDAIVAGNKIPAGTVLGVHQYSLYRSPRYFTDPESFHPERFEGKDPRFSNDRVDAVMPFLYGPRNCIGMNLAYAEMRLIIAKLIWNFDMRIADDSRTWMEGQKNYMLWVKPALNVHLTPVIR